MLDLLLANESAVRISVFLVCLMAMLVWELAAPRRKPTVPRMLRWTNNLVVVMLGTIVIKLCFPLLAVGLSLVANERGWGLFNLWPVSSWFAIPVSVLALDLAIYGQHVAFHKVPLLWRVHRMHHTDLDYDCSTGLRFHPLELLLSTAIKLMAIIVLGPPAAAVLIFELLLNAGSLFNHGNVAIPVRIDQILRRLLVTPDMHRVHHSILENEMNSNFGFTLPWWDRLFGTYCAQPRDGHIDMVIGLEQFRARRELWLDRMLVQPFTSATIPRDPKKSRS